MSYSVVILVYSWIQGYIFFSWYLRSQHETATKHYERASEMIHTCFLNVPSLLYFSKSDPISNDEMNNLIASKWEALGVSVSIQILSLLNVFIL